MTDPLYLAIGYALGTAVQWSIHTILVPWLFPKKPPASPESPRWKSIRTSLELGGKSARPRTLVIDGLKYESDGHRWFSIEGDGERHEETDSREAELAMYWALYGPKPPVDEVKP